MAAKDDGKDAERDGDEDGKRGGKKRRRWVIAGILAVIVVIVVIVVASSGSSKKNPVGPAQAKASGARFEGIAQKGDTLGNPQAKVTLYEFADLQRAPCPQFRNSVFPAILDRYVRPGKVKMAWRFLTFVGPDSITAARAAAAASAQNRMWDFIDLFRQHQKPENSRYVTDQFINNIAVGAAIDPAQLKIDMRSPIVDQQLGQSQNQAAEFHITRSPTFLVQKTGSKPQKIPGDGCRLSELTSPLDKALGK